MTEPEQNYSSVSKLITVLPREKESSLFIYDLSTFLTPRN